MSISHIDAITFAVADMRRAVCFYEKCGFTLHYGGPDADFTSFRAGTGYVNLIRTGAYAPHWWGRAIFRVASADAQHARLCALGLTPDAPPQDAPWGERYFHIRDPDGHELSFAESLPGSHRAVKP